MNSRSKKKRTHLFKKAPLVPACGPPRGRRGPGNGPFASRSGAQRDLQIRGTRKVPSEFFRPLKRAAAARQDGTKTILGTHLEENSPQGGTGGKRTWPRRRQAAGGPPGLPRCCHRLRSPHLTPSSPEPAYFGPLRPLGVQTSPASLTKKWPPFTRTFPYLEGLPSAFTVFGHHGELQRF